MNILIEKLFNILLFFIKDRYSITSLLFPILIIFLYGIVENLILLMVLSIFSILNLIYILLLRKRKTIKKNTKDVSEIISLAIDLIGLILINFGTLIQIFAHVDESIRLSLKIFSYPMIICMFYYITHTLLVVILMIYLYNGEVSDLYIEHKT